MTPVDNARVLGYARRVVVSLRAAPITALLAAACVSTSAHEAAIADERSRREAVEARVADVERALAAAEARAAELDRRLDATAKASAQSDYDLGVVARERDAARDLVVQLQGELERVADHLREFGEKNKKLSAAVDDLEKRASALATRADEAETSGQLLRDLALVLRDDLRSGTVQLVMRDGRAVLRLDVTRSFDAAGALAAPAARALTDVARVVAPAKGRVIEVIWSGAPTSKTDAQISAVSGELARQGLGPARVVRGPIPAAGDGGGWVEVIVRRSP